MLKSDSLTALSRPRAVTLRLLSGGLAVPLTPELLHRQPIDFPGLLRIVKGC